MCLWSLVRLKWIIRDDARGMTVGRWMVELQEAERAASSALSLVQWGGRFGSFPSTFDILQTTLMSQDKVTSQHGVIMMSWSSYPLGSFQGIESSQAAITKAF